MIEILVCIGVVATLIAILAPSLGRARASGMQTASLSNAHQLVSIIDLYTAQSKGVYPAVEEGKFYPVCTDNKVAYPYWQIYETWVTVVYVILPYCGNESVYLSPGAKNRRGPGGLFPPSYVYSTSFAGQPELWSASATPLPSLQKPATDHQVRFPSSKVLLWDNELGWVRRELRVIGKDANELCPTAFADGHGDLKNPALASEPVPNPFDPPIGRSRLHNTREGVQGRDY